MCNYGTDRTSTLTATTDFFCTVLPTQLDITSGTVCVLLELLTSQCQAHVQGIVLS